MFKDINELPDKKYMSQEPKTKKVKLGALWLREDNTGNEYFSGVIDGTNQRIVIFKNMFTENPNAPTHIIYEDNRPAPQKGGPSPTGAKTAAAKPKPAKAMKADVAAEEFPVVDPSEIPF